MAGIGDRYVALEVVRRSEANRLAAPERLQGLGDRLAAGEVTAQDWIVLATCTVEQEEPQWQPAGGSEEREEN